MIVAMTVYLSTYLFVIALSFKQFVNRATALISTVMFNLKQS